MSRYDRMFDRLSGRGEIGFGAFLMLGDPEPGRCLQAIEEVIGAGADFLELGIPFSDAVADGPIIQAAAARALDAGANVDIAIRLLAEVRARFADVPIGVLTYANIVMAKGPADFSARLAAAGADSLMIADAPMLESKRFAHACSQAGLDPVLIAAANTPDGTLASIARTTRGYTYVVARKGITGSDDRSDTCAAAALIDRLMAVQAPPPILGFGIADPDQVRAAARAGAAGVISGSAIIERLADGRALEPFVRAMKDATVIDARRAVNAP